MREDQHAGEAPVEENADPAPPSSTAQDPGGSSASRPADFATVLRAVEEAAREWGLRPDLIEGKFVSALMGAVEWSGRVMQSGQAELRVMLKENRDAAALDLARVKETIKAANAAVTQARNAQLALQVANENLAGKMMKETLPLFAEKLQGLLVIKEKAWNEGIHRRQVVIAGAVTLGLFLSGYAVRSWQDWTVTSAVDRCLTHSVQGTDGRFYCDVTDLHQVEQ